MILAMNGIFANCTVDIPSYSPLHGKVDCVCDHDNLECNCNINNRIQTAASKIQINCKEYIPLFKTDNKEVFLYLPFYASFIQFECFYLDIDDAIDKCKKSIAKINSNEIQQFKDCTTDFGLSFYKIGSDLLIKLDDAYYLKNRAKISEFKGCIFNTESLTTTNTTSIQNTISPFNLPGCRGYNINFYTNGNDILLKSDVDFTKSNTKINIIANNHSNIIIYEDAKSITLPNIIVNSEKRLNIKTQSSIQATNKYHLVGIESIFVHPKANLNINLKSNDGISRGVSNECKIDYDKNRHGTDSGDILFNTFSITNYGDTNISLETGKGGEGVKRKREDCAGSYDQSGGDGGKSGDLELYVTKIYNYGEFTLDLKTGNGGNGGYSSLDKGNDGYFNGGDGGSSGNIYISNIEQIINYNTVKFNVITGDGGWGGVQKAKHSKSGCDKGHNGWGGSSGDISDINITNLLNRQNTSKFELNIKNGVLGEIDITPKNACKAENKAGGEILTFGAPGKLGDITIDFLENKSSNGLEITSNFTFTNEQYKLAVVATSNGGKDGVDNGGNMRQLPDLNLRLSDIKINHLSNGSYLPKKISANIGIDDYEYFNNNIDITGCYINPTAVEYKVNNYARIVASNKDAVSKLNSSPIFDMTSRYCPHCEVMPLDDTQNRYTRNYSIFSSINGTINVGDLNIYYSNPSDQTKYFVKRTDYEYKSRDWSPNRSIRIPRYEKIRRKLPVYTNKNPITAVLNPKINSYEYKIKPEDLIYYSHTPEDDMDLLSQEDYLFCYGQEYILDGSITGADSNIKSFSFPFVPLRELFTD